MTGLRHIGLIGVLVWLALALPAAAQVAVRGGEHGEYTRVVLYAGDGQGWTLRQGEEVISIQLDARDARFDLSRAMDRLYLRRVTGIAPGPRPAELHLQLGCPCGARAFRTGSGMIVVDVGPELGAPGRDATASGPIASPPDDPGARMAGPVTLPLLPGRAGEAIGPPPVPAMPEPAEDAGEGGDLLPPIDLPARADPDLAEAEDRLLRQLGRAASQGLLTPSTPIRPRAEAGPPASPRPTEPPPPPEDKVNLRAITSIDAGSQRLLDRVATLLDEDRCLPDAMLDLRGWADPDRDFVAQIADLRAGLSDELDRVDDQSLTDLARAYLHFGFGAEARLSLRMRAEPLPGDAVLRGLARIMEYGQDAAAMPRAAPGKKTASGRTGAPANRDGGAARATHGAGESDSGVTSAAQAAGRVGSGGIFADQADCPGQAALWAVLARDPYPRGQPVNGVALRAAFNTLPSGLRAYLGPILARRLLAAGHPDLSDAVLRITDRAAEGPDDRLDLARAELLLDQGQTDPAVARLEAVIRTDGEMSPEALARLVDTDIAEGRPVPPDIIDSIAAAEREHRGGPLTPMLQRALALALASAGDFPEAFGSFAAHRADWPARDAAETQDRMMALLTANAAEPEFLRRAMALPAQEAASLRPATGNDAAARLLDLGFATVADAFLRKDLRGSGAEQRQILRARAALARGDPAGTTQALTGIEGETADRLRAEARAMAGDAAGASQLFAELGDTDRAAELAWSAGAWTATQTLAEGPLAEAARLATEEDGAIPAENGAPLPEDKVLARNRALLDTSQSARATLEELLSATRIDAPAPEPPGSAEVAEE